jgi:hypothetical protein
VEINFLATGKGGYWREQCLESKVDAEVNPSEACFGCGSESLLKYVDKLCLVENHPPVKAALCPTEFDGELDLTELSAVEVTVYCGAFWKELPVNGAIACPENAQHSLFSM